MQADLVAVGDERIRRGQGLTQEGEHAREGAAGLRVGPVGPEEEAELVTRHRAGCGGEAIEERAGLAAGDRQRSPARDDPRRTE